MEQGLWCGDGRRSSWSGCSDADSFRHMRETHAPLDQSRGAGKSQTLDHEVLFVIQTHCFLCGAKLSLESGTEAATRHLIVRVGPTQSLASLKRRRWGDDYPGIAVLGITAGDDIPAVSPCLISSRSCSMNARPFGVIFKTRRRRSVADISMSIILCPPLGMVLCPPAQYATFRVAVPDHKPIRCWISTIPGSSPTMSA